MLTTVIWPDVTVATTHNELVGDLELEPSGALVLTHEDGEEEVLSTVLPDYAPPPGTVYVPDDGAYDGLSRGLAAAGVAEVLEIVPVGPFAARFTHVRLRLAG